MSELLISPAGKFMEWNITDIYPTGNVVPKVNDGVRDWNVGLYRVISVVNNIAVLERWDPTRGLSMNTSVSFISSLSGYQPSVINRAFVNNQSSPRSLSLDTRFEIIGTENAYCKVFKGTDVTHQGQVISRNYTNTSENIPLNVLRSDAPGYKRPESIYLTIPVLDDEVISVVSYSNTHTPTGVTRFVVVNSSVIKPLEASSKYIVDVQLVTPLLSTSETDVIIAPAGVSVNPSSMSARLIYNDGDVVEDVPIDGVKCALLGVENFNTTWPSNNVSVVLAYYPDADEPAINVLSGNNRVVSHIYALRTEPVAADFTYRIYIVPVYDYSTSSYTLEYWLTNAGLEYLINLTESGVDVTVTQPGGEDIDLTSASFGILQHLHISVNIGDVIPGIGDYTFSQITRITLEAPIYGSAGNKPWVILYSPNALPAYGNQNSVRFIGRNTADRELDVSIALDDQTDWIVRLYENLFPTYDAEIFDEMPMPSHFRIHWKTTSGWEVGDYIPVEDWETLIPTFRSDSYTNMETIVLTWHMKLPGDLSYRHLGVSPVVSYVWIL